MCIIINIYIYLVIVYIYIALVQIYGMDGVNSFIGVEGALRVCLCIYQHFKQNH